MIWLALNPPRPARTPVATVPTTPAAVSRAAEFSEVNLTTCCCIPLMNCTLLKLLELGGRKKKERLSNTAKGISSLSHYMPCFSRELFSLESEPAEYADPDPD